MSDRIVLMSLNGTQISVAPSRVSVWESRGFAGAEPKKVATAPAKKAAAPRKAPTKRVAKKAAPKAAPKEIANDDNKN